MKQITLEDCKQLQGKFKKYCETAEQHQFGLLLMVDMMMEKTIRSLERGEQTTQKNLCAMFRVVLRTMGEDYSQYVVDGGDENNG
jgi:hypothetical protein